MGGIEVGASVAVVLRPVLEDHKPKVSHEDWSLGSSLSPGFLISLPRLSLAQMKTGSQIWPYVSGDSVLRSAGVLLGFQAWFAVLYRNREWSHLLGPSWPTRSGACPRRQGLGPLQKWPKSYQKEKLEALPIRCAMFNIDFDSTRPIKIIYSNQWPYLPVW